MLLNGADVTERIRLPEIDHDDCEETAAEAKAGLKGLWKHRCFTWGVMALFCYEIAEISINSFLYQLCDR